MKTVATFAGLAGYAVAQGAYGYGAEASTTAYACNPAHEYPNGQVCTSIGGSLTLVSPSTSAPATSTGYACNPAHQYPNGQYCTSIGGSLTLVYPTTAAPATTTGYACNPAHQYPNGQYCTSIGGSLTLVYPTTAAPATTTGYACNPAHQYPNGQYCTSIGGSLTLVYPSASASVSKGSNTTDCYSAYNVCRGAPDSNKASCAAQYAQCLGYNPFASNGTNTVTPVVPGHGDVTVTAIVSSFTTVCPSPTTLTINSKTYTVTKATTLTITDCPCTIQTPAKSLPPATTVTAIVSSFTTVCPSPTTLTINSKTYTVTKPTTLTITDCEGGCKITTPVSAIPPAVATTPVAPAGSPSTPGNNNPAPSAGVPAYTPHGTSGASATRGGSAYPSNSLTPYTGGAQQTIASGTGFFAIVAAMLFL